MTLGATRRAPALAEHGERGRPAPFSPEPRAERAQGTNDRAAQTAWVAHLSKVEN